LEKAFAIKLLKTAGPPTPDAFERFRREAVALGRLRHPYIVEVTDFGIDRSEGDRPYIVTELLEGRLLSDVCRDQGPLPLAQALPLLGQIAAAIDAAHDAGVLHRDLKPGNIFVCSENLESPRVKVLDFGLAELLSDPARSGSGTVPDGGESPPGLTTTGSLLGTPLYLAPELVQLGEASRSSDIYSFGVIAYEILGGKPPFQGTLGEVLASHLEAEPPPLPLPPKVWRPLWETLQKDPALRPSTAGEVVHRLLGEKVEASATAAEGRGAGLTRGRMKIALATIAIIALCGLALAIGRSPLARRQGLVETPRTDSEAQKQTLADISTIGTAMFSWLTDQVGAAAGQSQVPATATLNLADYREISRIDLERILVPRYIPKVPEVDGWGHPYELYLNASFPAKGIASIRSAGRDGIFAESSYVVGYFDPESFDEDIVWSDGFFVRWPQKPSERLKFRRRQRPVSSLDSRCTAWCADDSSVSVTCPGECSAVDQICDSSGSPGGYVTCNGTTTSRCSSYQCPTVRCEGYMNKACSDPGSRIECYWTDGQTGSCDCIHNWLCGYS
jgi:hypothetical protein